MKKQIKIRCCKEKNACPWNANLSLIDVFVLHFMTYNMWKNLSDNCKIADIFKCTKKNHAKTCKFFMEVIL